MVIVVFIRNYSLLALLASILFLSGCSTSDRGCRSGDNFGNDNTEFDSYREANSPDYRDDKNVLISTRSGAIRWQNTGLSTTGEPIVVEISGSWTPWGANSMKVEKAIVVDGKATTVLEFLDAKDHFCRSFPVQDVVSASELIPNVRYITLLNPAKNAGGYPCWLTEGKGLYLLFRNPSDPDPNSSLVIVQNPVSGTIHLNRSSKPNSSRFEIEVSTEELKDSGGIPKSLRKGMEVYGKINDSYYPDNYGTYQLNFISGVYKTKRTKAFQGAYDFIVKPVQDASKKIFLSIVTQEAYQRAVYTLLTLFIVCTGLLYLMGAVQSQLGELTLRLLKIGLILVLLTPSAWSFFYNHMFKLYTEGLAEVINIIVSGDKFNPDEPLDFMDRITEKILTPNLAPRMTAVVNANGLLGCIYLIFLVLIILFFAICVIFSFASYIIGMILLAIMTAMFPIFLTMILFNFTRQVFNDYLDSILGYSFQIIICFTTLFFMSRVIEWNIERTLGFRICVAPTISFNPFSTIDPEVLDQYTENKDGTVTKSESDTLVFKNWVPGEAGLYKTLPAWSMFAPVWAFKSIYDLLLSKKYGFTYEIQKMLVPPEYERTRYRYTALPFLEPDENMADTDNLSSSAFISCMTYRSKDACDPDKVFPGAETQNDHIRIKSIMFTKGSNKFVDFSDLFIIILFMFILWELNINFIPTISKWIALSGKGYVMPTTALGNSIIMSFNQYMRAVQKLSEKKGPIKYLGMGLSLLTTTQGIFWQKMSAVGVGKLEDTVSGLGTKAIRKILMVDTFTTKSDGMGGRVSMIQGNRVTSFASQVGRSMLDSVLYQDALTRSIDAQARDKDREEKNLMGIDKFRHRIGGTIDRIDDSIKNDQKAMLYQGIKGMHVSPINRIIIGDRSLDWSWKDGLHFKDELSGKKDLFKEDTERFRERFGGERNSADFDSKVYWEAILRKYNNDVIIDTTDPIATNSSTPAPVPPPHPVRPPSPTPPNFSPPPPPSAPPGPSPAPEPHASSASSTIPTLVTTGASIVNTPTTSTPSEATASIISPSTTTTDDATPPPVFVPPPAPPAVNTTSDSTYSMPQPSSKNNIDTSKAPSLGGPYDEPSALPLHITPPLQPSTELPQSAEINLDKLYPNVTSASKDGKLPGQIHPIIPLPTQQQTTTTAPPSVDLPTTSSQIEQISLTVDSSSDPINNINPDKSNTKANNSPSLESPEVTTPLDQQKPEIIKDNQLKQDLIESITINPEVQKQIDLLTKEIKDTEEKLSRFTAPELVDSHEKKLSELRKRLDLISK